MKTAQRSAGVVILRQQGGHGRYLLLRAYSHWDFPKGLLEPGEEAIAAARREVEELLQIGIGDAQVPPLAAHVHARALGARHLQPAPRPIAGLAEVTGPHAGSALVEFDFGISPLPAERNIVLADDNEAHEGVRKLDAAQEQIDRFLRNGVIESFCEGPCDPE